MSVETLQYLSIGSFILAGVMLVVAVILFFAFKIPAVIGDLSGATARKAIENIRQQQNAASGELSGETAQDAAAKKAAEPTPSGRTRQQTSDIGFRVSTAKLRTDPLQQRAIHAADKAGQGSNETTVLSGANETTVLQGGNQTTVLNGANQTMAQSGANETTVLSSSNQTTVQQDANETTVLNAANQATVPGGMNETTVLNGGNQTRSPNAEAHYGRVAAIPLIVEYEIGFWTSMEIIE